MASFRRIVLILLAIVVSVVLLLVGAFWYSSIHPSDASLERLFYDHRAEYERIVRMMDEDIHMVRIADDFTRKDDDWNEERPESQWGISKARWDQYREIFRLAEVPTGTQRGSKSCDVEIIAWTFGLAVAGSSLSFVHCGKPSRDLVNDYLPCLERKDSGSKVEDGTLIRYRKIQPDWYIYEFTD